MSVRKLEIVIVFMILGTGCSDQIERAINKGQVVSDYGKTGNLDKFYTFLDNVEAHKESSVKITRITKEGDPIYWDLHYDGKLIQVKKDTRQDKYGGKQVIEFTCEGIKTTVAEKETSYDLTECNPTRTSEILVISNE